VQREIEAELIRAIDRALRNAPPRGTSMTSDQHVDALLDLRLAVHELSVLSPLETDVEATHRIHRRVGFGRDPRTVLEPSSEGSLGAV
jgi:hypothetical protein